MGLVTCPRDRVRCADVDLPPGDLVGGDLSCRGLSSLGCRSFSCRGGLCLLETVLLAVNGGGVSGLRVLDVELRAQRVEGGGVGLPILGVPLLRSVGLLERPQESDRCGVVSRLSVWRVGNFRLRV